MVMHLPRDTSPRRLYRYAWGPAAHVADAMTWPAMCVDVGATVAKARTLLEEADVHFLPVVAGGRLVGMTCACQLDGPAAGVADVMEARVISVGLATSAREAVRLMLVRGLECLPVTTDRRVFGVFTLGDAVRAGVLDPADRPRCAACRERRHLIRGRGDVPFCLGCLGSASPATGDLYEELGGGD